MSKTLSLLLVSAALAAAFGYFASAKSIVPAVLAGVLWAAVLAVATFLISDRRVIWISAVLQAAAAVFFLFQFVNWPIVMVGGASIVILLVLAHQAGQNGIKNSFKIQFFSLGKHGAAHIMTAAAIIITIASLSSLSLDAPKLARQFFDKTIVSAEALLPVELRQLPVSVRAQLYEQIFTAIFGWIAGLTPAAQQGIIIGIWALVFLSIKGALVLGNWVVLGVGFLIYEVLRSAQFFTITLESRSKEVIVLK